MASCSLGRFSRSTEGARVLERPWEQAMSLPKFPPSWWMYRAALSHSIMSSITPMVLTHTVLGLGDWSSSVME